MSVQIIVGDCRRALAGMPDESVQLCVTSPPYFGLRDYGTASWVGGSPACNHVVSHIRTGDGMAKFSKALAGGGHKAGKITKLQAKDICPKCGAQRIDSQIGQEETPLAYVAEMVGLFREVRRVLRKDGVMFLNLGDSYASQGGAKNTPHLGKHLADRARSQKVISRSKRLPRGAGNRWGGGDQACAGFKPKELLGIPWRVAMALQDDGWYLRQDIIWSKPNPMPESVEDRCTKAHEYLFLMTKSEKYYWDAEAIAEPAIYAPGCGWEEEPKGTRSGKRGKKQMRPIDPEQSFRAIRPMRNKRSVWTVPAQGFTGEYCTACGIYFQGEGLSALRVEKIEDGDRVIKRRHCSCGRHDAWLSHFATFPPALIEPCIMAGSRPGDDVLDPFGGAGTTGLVADRAGRNGVLIELNQDYASMARQRIAQEGGMFATVSCSKEYA